MTTRKPTSGKSGQTERAATKAELQRIEERRHIETVLRKERRVRWPKAPRLGKPEKDPKVVVKSKEAKEPRPLTPAEKERIAERRHVEAVMRNARRTRLQVKKVIPLRSDGTGTPAVAATSSGQPTDTRKINVALVVAGAVLACAIFALSLTAVLQQGKLAERMTSLREETSLLSSKQQAALEEMDQALQQLAATEQKVEAKLQAVADAQGQITTKLGALEAGRAADATKLAEQLANVQKTTSDGLAAVTSRLDSEESLAASVRELLPALRPDSADSVQTPSEIPAP